MGKKMKVLTAQQAIERYNEIKKELGDLYNKLAEKNEKIKEANIKNMELLNLNAELRKKNKMLYNITKTQWITNYLEGE
jgi:lantibiotic modifying enzyme